MAHSHLIQLGCRLDRKIDEHCVGCRVYLYLAYYAYAHQCVHFCCSKCSVFTMLKNKNFLPDVCILLVVVISFIGLLYCVRGNQHSLRLNNDRVNGRMSFERKNIPTPDLQKLNGRKQVVEKR